MTERDTNETEKTTLSIGDLLLGIEGLENACLTLERMYTSKDDYHEIEELRSIMLGYVFVMCEELTNKLRGGCK